MQIYVLVFAKKVTRRMYKKHYTVVLLGGGNDEVGVLLLFIFRFCLHCFTF